MLLLYPFFGQKYTYFSEKFAFSTKNQRISYDTRWFFVVSCPPNKFLRFVLSN